MAKNRSYNILKNYIKQKIHTILIACGIFFIASNSAAQTANPFFLDEVLMPTDFTERHISRSSLERQLSELVKNTTKNKAKYVEFFKGPGSLIGIIIQGNTDTGKKTIAWHPAGTDLLILGGAVVDSTGTNQSTLAKTAFLDQKRNITPKKSSRLDLSHMRSFVLKEGRGKDIKTISVIVDPECPTCDKIMTKLTDPTVRFKDNVQVLLLPVARSKQGKRQASFILGYGYTKGIEKARNPELETRTELYEGITFNTDKLASQLQAFKTPMLVHNGAIITSFKPFIVSTTQDPVHN